MVRVTKRAASAQEVAVGAPAPTVSAPAPGSPHHPGRAVHPTNGHASHHTNGNAPRPTSGPAALGSPIYEALVAELGDPTS